LPRGGGGQPGSWVCSWRGAGVPSEPREDPVATYAQLFAGSGGGDPTAVRQLVFQRKSLLDYVGGSLQRFARRVGSEDRRYVEGHLQSVRELEQRLDARPPGTGCGDPPAPIDINDHAKYANVYQAQVDLMLAALTCGVANVVTLQLADASGVSVNFGAFVPGIPEKGTGYKTAFRNWHDVGHNPILGGVDHKAIVDEWWMSRFAELLARLKAAPDLGGTSQLENSVVLWANTMEDGANHNTMALPWILAGHGGGTLRTGQHVMAGGRPSSGVLAAIAAAMDVPGQPFGPALGEILA
jgi:hypothetical protein